MGGACKVIMSGVKYARKALLCKWRRLVTCRQHANTIETWQPNVLSAPEGRTDVCSSTTNRSVTSQLQNIISSHQIT